MYSEKKYCDEVIRLCPKTANKPHVIAEKIMRCFVCKEVNPLWYNISNEHIFIVCAYHPLWTSTMCCDNNIPAWVVNLIHTELSYKDNTSKDSGFLMKVIEAEWLNQQKRV